MTIVRRYRRWLYALCGLILAGALTLWLLKPPSFHLVKEHKVNGGSRCLLGKTGFLLFDPPTQFIFCDWIDGHVRWRVNMAPPSGQQTWQPFPYYGDFQLDNPVFNLSPDGHYLAAATPEHGRVAVRIWHDGTLVGGQDLAYRTTSFTHSYCALAVADSRQVLLVNHLLTMPNQFNFSGLPITINSLERRYLYKDMEETSTAYVLHGNKLVATSPFPAETLLTPDGSLVIDREGNVFVPRINKGRVLLQNLTRAKGNAIAAVPSGFLFNEKDLIGIKGIKRSSVKRQRYLPYKIYLPGSQKAHIITAPLSKWVIDEGYGNHSRVQCLETGESWILGEDGTNAARPAELSQHHMKFIVSTDGRYVVRQQVRMGKPIDYPMRRLRDRIARILRFPLRDSSRTIYESFDVFERPGELRARFDYSAKSLLFSESYPPLTLVAISPDGKTVLLAKTTVVRNLPRSSYCLYRW